MRLFVSLLLGWSTLAWALPNLIVDDVTLSSSVGVELQTFQPTACELQPVDLCVGAPGGRKVLRFSVFTPNIGDEDLVVGNPALNPNEQLPNGEPKWVFSQCHNHYHFQTFARYELRRRGETSAVLTGQKRSFCIEDTRRTTATTDPVYCCNPGAACPDPVQGIQKGWGDLYPSNLPCQWIDITDGPTPGQDLAPGDYDLCVLVNTGGYLNEQPQNDNSACVPITIDAPLRKLPKVHVRKPNARSVVKVGKKYKIQWSRKLSGKFQQQEVWFSSDGGVTFNLLAVSTHRGGAYPWTVPADAVTDNAVIRVVVWQRYPKDGRSAGALQRGLAHSAVFRVVP